MTDTVDIIYLAIFIAILLGFSAFMIASILNPKIRVKYWMAWVILAVSVLGLFFAPEAFGEFDTASISHRGSKTEYTGTSAIILNVVSIIVWVIAIIWSIVVLRRGAPKDADTRQHWN